MRDPLQFIRNKFVKDAAALQVSGMLNQASQFLSSALLAFLLGAEGQGLFVVAVMLQGLFYNVINVGAVQATISQLASASARGLHGKVAAWMGFLAKVYLLFNTLLIVLGWWVLPRWAEWRYDNYELGVWAWWLCFWPLIDTPRAVVFVALQGTRRMLKLGQLDNAQELLRAFLVIGGALITGSPVGAIYGEIVSRALASLLALEMYRTARRDGGPELPSLWSVFRQIPEIPLRRGMPLAYRVGVLKNVSTIFVSILPRLLLGEAAGMAAVAYFHVAQRIMGMPLIMMQGVSRTILPALSQLAGLKDMVQFRRLYKRTTVIAGGLISAGILAAVPFIPWVVGVFYPADYVQPTFLYALILVPGHLAFAFAVGQEAFYIVSAQFRVMLLLSLLGAAVTIPVNFLLIDRLPVTGAAWGLSFYMTWVLVHFVYVAYYFRTRSPQPAANDARPVPQ